MGTPTLLPDPVSGTQASTIVAGDFGNNGNLDLATTYVGSDYIGFYVGNGDGTFQSPTLIQTGLPVTGPLYAADFDQNGNVDLAAATTSDLLVFPGNGDGAFGSPTLVQGLANPDQITAGDFRGDGLLDLGADYGVSPGGFAVALNTSPDAAISSFEVSTPPTATVTDPFTLTVTAENDLGAPLPGYTGTIDFSNADQAAGFPASAQFTSEDRGVLQLSVTPELSGKLTVNLQDSVVATATGTTILTVNPGPVSGVTSTVNFASSSDASGTPDLATITVEDAEGDPITGLTSNDFIFSLSGKSTGTFGDVTETSTPGTYSAEFTGIIAGTASSLTLTANGVQLNNQPSITVVPGTPDPNKSTVSFETQIDVSGTTDTVTIALEDAAGNAITGLVNDDFHFGLASGTSTGIFGNVSETSTAGTYTTNYTGAIAGSEDTYKLQVNGIQLSEEPQVTVVPGPEDPNGCSFTLTSSTDESGTPDQATIVLVDSAGNPITGQGSNEFNFSFTGGTSTGTFVNLAETSTPGTYTANFIGSIAGTSSKVILVVNSVQLNMQPVVAVTPGSIDPHKTTAVFANPIDASGATDQVTIAVEDAAGNAISGLSYNQFSLSLSNGTSTGIFGNVVESSSTPGTYTALFTGELAGTPSSLNLTVGEVNSEAEPTLQVVPGVVNGGTTTAIFNSSADISGTSDTISISVEDAAGNAIGGLINSDFNLSLSSGGSTGTIGNVTESSTPGTYTAPFTGMLAGTPSSLNLIIDNIAIDAEPTVQVTPGPVNAGTTTAAFTSQLDASGTPDIFTIAVKDAAGNAIGGLASNDFSLSLSSGLSTGTFGSVAETQTPGTYTGTFTGIIAGSTSTAIVKVSGVALTEKPPVTVTPGAVDAEQTTASFASSTMTAGTTDNVTIVVKDAAGNPIGGLVNDDFEVSLTGGGSGGNFGTVSETASAGIYSTVFSGIVAGSPSSLELTINAVQIANLPAVQVIPGSLNLGKSSIILASSTDQSGTADTATIVLEDAYGNGITGLPSSAFSFRLAGGTSTGTFSSVTETSTPGTYGAVFTGAIAGAASTVTLTVNNNIQLTTQPQVTVEPGAPGSSETTVNFASSSVVSGSTDAITIVVKDAAGNLIPGLTNSDFNLNLTGGMSTGTFNSVTESSTPGTYTTLFTAVKSGTASSLVVAIDNIQIAQEPEVRVMTGPLNGSTSSFNFASPTVASGTTDTVTIVLEDAAGNAISSLTNSAFAFTLIGGSSTGTLGKVTESTTPGTYTAKFTGIIAGTPKTLHLKVKGLSIASHPAVQVIPGAASAIKTTVSVASAIDMSGHADLVTVMVKDADGNVVSGLVDSDFNFALSGGTSTANFGTFDETNTGVYTEILTGNQAGSATPVKVVIDNTTIESQPVVTVKPGTVSASNSSAAFVSSTLTSGKSETLILVVKDAAGNAITSITKKVLTLGLYGGQSDGTFGSMVQTATPGTYTIQFTGTTSGTASALAATINGVQLNSEPTVHVSAGATNGKESTASFANSEVAPGGMDTLTLEVKDAAGNAVTGLINDDYVFSLSGTSTGSFGTVTETSIPGTYTVVFTADTSGAASQLSVWVDGILLRVKPKVTVMA